MKKDKLIQDFLEILDETPSQEVNENTVIRDLDEWDSMTALSLMAMIDEVYSKSISPQELEKIIDLNDLFSFLKK
jgi:acyl carrier protein